jgi:hypothetical protein
VRQESKRVPVFHSEFPQDRDFESKRRDRVEAALRDPFQGPGKPEPLGYLPQVAGQGASRRKVIPLARQP